MEDIKYPRSSWIFYVLHNKHRFVDLPNRERIKMLSTEWRLLRDKELFNTLAKQDRERFFFMKAQLPEKAKRQLELTHRIKCKGTKRPWTSFMKEVQQTNPEVADMSPPLRATFCAGLWKQRKPIIGEHSSGVKQETHIEAANIKTWVHCVSLELGTRIQTGIAKCIYSKYDISNTWVCIRVKGKGNGLCITVVYVGLMLVDFAPSELDISNGYVDGTHAFPIQDCIHTQPFLLRTNHAKTCRLQEVDRQQVLKLLLQRHKLAR